MRAGNNEFWFNGRSSREFGVRVTGSDYGMAIRDQSVISVPGRNGNLIIDNGRYENITVSYECSVVGLEAFNAVREWLSSGAGYCELIDSYNPEYFRKARYAGGLTVDQWRAMVGSFVVDFDAQPLRYRRDGNGVIALSASGSVYNPYLQSQPKLKVYGTAGALYINGQSIVFSSIDGYTEIDEGNAFKGGENKNSTVIMPDQIFLEHGENLITLDGLAIVEITPRWCER